MPAKIYKYYFNEEGNKRFVEYLKKLLDAIKNEKLEVKNKDSFTKLKPEKYVDSHEKFHELMKFFYDFAKGKSVKDQEIKNIWSGATAIEYISSETIESLGDAYNRIKTYSNLQEISLADKKLLQAKTVNMVTVNKLLNIFGSGSLEKPKYFQELSWEPIEPIIEENINKAKSKQTKVETGKIHDAREKAQEIIERICGKHRHLPIGLNDIYVDFQEDLKIPTNIKKKIEQPSLRLIITGSLGIGKTTYLKKLALNILDVKSKKGNTEENIAPNQVPLFINLRDYVDETKENKVNLLSYIAKYYQFISVDPLKELLRGESDQCVLLLDSLDQISDLESNQLIDEIAEFVRDYPINDYILTSRDTVEINKLENFEVIQLSEIKINFPESQEDLKNNDEELNVFISNWLKKDNNKRVDTFISNWLKAILEEKQNNQNNNNDVQIQEQNNNDVQIQEIKYRILRNLITNEDLRFLASKPLMFSLICTEHAKHEQNDCSEKNLTEWHIVHRAVKTWLEKSNQDYWDEQEQVNGNDTSISINFVYELLEFIAYKTIDIRILNISRIKLSQHINNFVKDYYGWDDKQKTNNFTDKILWFLENTYGFTLLKDDNIYSFPHVIFRNYFAIRYIYNKYDDMPDFVKEVAGKPQWNNIINKAKDFPTELILGLPEDTNSQ